MRIGVDFDNTLAGYDQSFAALALEAGYLAAVPAGGKRAVRDAVRELPDGDVLWQNLQAEAYGPRMVAAEVFEGAAEVLTGWRERGGEIYIVSHKTRFASQGQGAFNLRRAALDWLDGNGFLGQTGPGLAPERIHFKATRADKLAAIGALRLDLFIDDLEEVFAEPGFPEAVSKILFDPHRSAAADGGYQSFASWRDIGGHVDAVGWR